MNWLIPFEIALVLSARDPKALEAPLDVLVGIDSEWKTRTEEKRIVAVHFEFEREDSDLFLNYQLTGGVEQEAWFFEGSTKRSQARPINNQKVTGGRKWLKFLLMGVGVTTSKYDVDRSRVVMDFGIPLPGGGKGKWEGHLRHSTNYSDVSIIDGIMELQGEDIAKGVTPAIEIQFYRYNNIWDRRFKVKFTIKLREESDGE